VGRGVLIDYKAYAGKRGLKYSPFDSQKITIDDIETIAKEQKVSFKQGDIIIIRSGFTEEMNGAPGEEQEKMLGTHRACGVEGTEESAKWFWNKHFSAVAGDTIGFEVIPPIKPDGKEGETKDLVLHQYFLGLFGLHIGELWDLKALSQMCEKTGRYSFLLTSIPLNVPGGIGSPPNALAIF